MTSLGVPSYGSSLDRQPLIHYSRVSSTDSFEVSLNFDKEKKPDSDSLINLAEFSPRHDGTTSNDLPAADNLSDTTNHASSRGAKATSGSSYTRLESDSDSDLAV